MADRLPMCCFKCGGPLIEARITRVGGKDLVDPDGATIKTKCRVCGRLFGYRPYEERQENRGSKVPKSRPSLLD